MTTQSCAALRHGMPADDDAAAVPAASLSQHSPRDICRPRWALWPEGICMPGWVARALCRTLTELPRHCSRKGTHSRPSILHCQHSIHPLHTAVLTNTFNRVCESSFRPPSPPPPPISFGLPPDPFVCLRGVRHQCGRAVDQPCTARPVCIFVSFTRPVCIVVSVIRRRCILIFVIAHQSSTWEIEIEIGTGIEAATVTETGSTPLCPPFALFV